MSVHIVHTFSLLHSIYPLVNKHSYLKWSIEIVDLPIHSMVDLSSSLFFNVYQAG